MASIENSPFLCLPTELRLLIYSYALLDSPAITIGTAELVGSHPDIVHRLYADGRSPFPGIPQHHEPVIETQYNPSLLSITNPAIVPLHAATSRSPQAVLSSHPFANDALLLVNKQIHEELMSHFKILKNRRTSLFISYPHGLHVLRTALPHLTRQAQSIHIAGVYHSRTFSATHSAMLRNISRPSASPEEFYNSSGYTPNSHFELSSLIASVLGNNPTTHIRKLELRIYYPGADSYSTVWGDDNSPTVVALKNIYGGEIGIEVWRGQRGTGVYLTARANQAERKRVVSTVWRRLDEGRRGEPACGNWVVDPKWPDWEEEYDNERTALYTATTIT